MPSLIRFLLILGFLGGITYGALLGLATFVEPQPREMTIPIPSDRLNKQR